MTLNSAVLHLICGKIAAGKSTLSNELGKSSNTIVISEDEWLSSLFSTEMKSISDYVRCSQRLKTVMKPHIIDLLESGVSVILDFPANTVMDRGWMREIYVHAGVPHKLHYLEVSDEICKSRLLARNLTGKHEFAATEKQFELITKYFEPPSLDEGFNVILYG